MRARIKASDMLSKPAREAVEEYILAEVNRTKNEEMARFLKIICATLHKEFGFGGKRLTDLVFKSQEFMQENKGNEIFWDKIDELLIDKLGIPFSREDYEEREKAVIENARR